MDKKSKILIWTFIAITLLSIGYTFYKTIILQDFEVIESSEEYVEEEEMGEEEVTDEDTIVEDEETLELETETSAELE